MNYQADPGPSYRDDAQDDDAYLSEEDDLSTSMMCEDEDLFDMALDWQLEEAMCQVAVDERRDYDEAMEEAPELVRKETPFEHFLWTEDQDGACAALRLSRYWKGRKYVFGERWLRPLNQTAMGALYPEDVALFRRGYFVMLERPSGGLILVVDESKLPCQPGLSKTRLVFYLMYLHAIQARKGITTIHIISGAACPPVELQTDSWAIYRTGLPFKLDRWRSFVVQSCFEAGKEDLIDFLTYQTAQSVTYKSHKKASRIIGNSVRETVRLLQEQTGVELECLPRCIGGCYDYRFFHEWIRQRLTIEATEVAFPMHSLTLSAGIDLSTRLCESKPLTIVQKPRGIQTNQDKMNNRGTPSPLSNDSASTRKSAHKIPVSSNLVTEHTTAKSTSPEVQSLAPFIKQLKVPQNPNNLTTQSPSYHFMPVLSNSANADSMENGSLRPIQALQLVDYRRL
mmetsp:Transcript_5295/g.10460  ORF Transcript_5295/g.10460 Transcript_5295/m.10460 type:complete len:454 (+) Transcript_5295:152-1513(+)